MAMRPTRRVSAAITITVLGATLGVASLAVGGDEANHVRGHGHASIRPVDEGPDRLDLRRSPDDPTDGAAVPVGAGPADVAVGHGVLWVVNGRDGTVSRHDPASGQLLGEPVHVAEGLTAAAVGRDAVWVVSASAGTLHRLDVATGRPTGHVEVGTLARAVDVAADGTVFATSAGDGTLVRVDPRTLRARSVRVRPDVLPAFDGPGPSAVDVADGVAWVVNTLARELVRFDAGTLAPIGDPIPTGAGATDVLVAAGTVWVANTTAGTLTRYDAADGRPVGAPIVVDERPELGGGPAALTVAFGRLWVLNNDERTVTAIDLATEDVVDLRFLANHHADVPRAGGLAATERVLWVTDEEGDRVVRLAPRPDGP